MTSKLKGQIEDISTDIAAIRRRRRRRFNITNVCLVIGLFALASTTSNHLLVEVQAQGQGGGGDGLGDLGLGNLGLGGDLGNIGGSGGGLGGKFPQSWSKFVKKRPS